MKKLMLPILLVTGLAYLVSGKVHPPPNASPCNGVHAEKEILLPVERLLWALDAP
ncbi:hypothetical protein [Paraflavitalea soli]|uniref:hypothetical protein n=1 Tax=Paraflavitalea soli TaxID=2315862 RepID=UPI0013C40C15|nr:hypothetical protein [Paraflavitalea soli]